MRENKRKGTIERGRPGTPPRAISPERIREYAVTTALVQEEHEAYFPSDIGSYLGHSYFEPCGLSDIRGFWKNTLDLMERGLAPRELGLYIHWPFCISRCSFCFCSMILPGGPLAMRSTAEMILRELEALRDLFEGVPFHSIYIGGGTPTYLPSDLLESLLGPLRDWFRFEPDAEFYMEASPPTLTPEKMDLLEKYGVNHVTLGVQSMDPSVLRGVDRRSQTRENVERAYRLLRRSPEVITSIDLMYGLEGQDDESFLADFRAVMEMRPHNFRVYAFDPRHHTAFAEAGKSFLDGKRRRQFELMDALDGLAAERGFRTSTVDPAAPDYLNAITRQCRQARRFGGSVLSVGASALSHAYGSAWYKHPPPGRLGPLEEGIPAFYHMKSNLSEEMRGFALRHLYTSGAVPRDGFRTMFGRDLAEIPELASAVADIAASGKMEITPGSFRFLGKSRVERLLYGKRFHSPAFGEAFRRAHAGRWEKTLAACGEGLEGALELADVKLVSALMRMYFGPGDTRPAWHVESLERETWTAAMPGARA